MTAGTATGRRPAVRLMAVRKSDDSGPIEGTHAPARFWYTVVVYAVTVVLIGWGGFVTSIDAGLAVPDWPSSFNSYDPFNPWPEWWTLTPVLAEHGHRLLGALVGLLTVGLALWTWIADRRRWMRILGVSALILVSLQGLLGGLRVVWVSLDLAVVHACVAQLFFALIACMALFVSRTWQRPFPARVPEIERVANVRRIAVGTSALIYLQIILGALLRHPGTGIDTTLATLHIAGATVVTIAIVVLMVRGRKAAHGTTAARLVSTLGVLLLAQVALGLTAYLVLLDEQGMVVPSNLQVVVNTLHLVIGALLFSSSVVVVGVLSRMLRVHSATPVPTAATRAFNLA